MINRLFEYLQPVLGTILRRPLITLAAGLMLAAAGFWLASNLRIDNDLSKLIPEDYASVQALNTLRDRVGGEHEVAVAIQSPSFEANKAFAETLIEPALDLTGEDRKTPYFVRAEFRKNINFLKNNALYFATDEELDLLEEFLENTRRSARQEANPFYFDLEEDSVDTDSLAGELNQKYAELVGSEYLVSEDSTIMVVKFFPSGSQTDLQFIQDAYNDLRQLIDQLNPSSFHPEMNVVAAGRMIRTLIEIETITRDVIESFGIGVMLLMAIVLLYFYVKIYRIRTGGRHSFRYAFQQLKQIPAYLIIIVLPLAVSLCWTFGIAYLVYGNLNIMTSTLGLLLFGMGIDFGIHFFARYAEERGEDKSIEEAITTTFMTTGQAILAVGITTAAAFFILLLADFKGFSEFGLIAGIGLLLAIIAYILFLPALLILLERSPLLDLQRLAPEKAVSRPGTPGSSGYWKTLSIGIVGVGIAVTLVSMINVPDLEFEYNFGELEPDYEEYQELNSLVSEVYSDRRTRNAAYIIVDEPSEAPQVAEILRQRKAADQETPTIQDVETFQDRYPVPDQETRAKLDRLTNIREMLNDPFLEGADSDDIERLKQAASPRSAIPADSIPDFLRAPFTSASGTIGNLVIIHPSVGLSDGRNSMNFADDVGTVSLPNGNVYHAGSTSIVASDMLRLMMAEAPVMLVLTIIFIIILKLLILQKVRWIVLALLPLAGSFIWLFGLMDLIGWKLNFYNLVVLPTILGIGDDSGIHIVHRYMEEGKGSIGKVLRSTGEHITVSAFTTMLGFSGLLFSIHPGMRTIGEVAILGIGLSWLAAMLLLPALLKLLEYRNQLNSEEPNDSGGHNLSSR